MVHKFEKKNINKSLGFNGTALTTLQALQQKIGTATKGTSQQLQHATFIVKIFSFFILLVFVFLLAQHCSTSTVTIYTAF